MSVPSHSENLCGLSQPPHVTLLMRGSGMPGILPSLSSAIAVAYSSTSSAVALVRVPPLASPTGPPVSPKVRVSLTMVLHRRAVVLRGYPFIVVTTSSAALVPQ